MITREAWQRSITDDQGNLLTGVQISVFQQDGITPATIYSGLTDAAMANPFNTGVQTVARFYAEPGLYVIRAFKAGAGTQEWVNVDISGFSVRQDIAALKPPKADPAPVPAWEPTGFSDINMFSELDGVMLGGRVTSTQIYQILPDLSYAAIGAPISGVVGDLLRTVKRLRSGVLLACVDNSISGQSRIVRSSDNGASWQNVLVPDVLNVRALTDRSICDAVIQGASVILFGEYNVNPSASNGNAQDKVVLWKSYDQGVNWQEVTRWNTDGVNNIRHIHFVRQYADNGPIYLSVGDTNVQSGFFRWDGAAGWPVNKSFPDLVQSVGLRAAYGRQPYRAVDAVMLDGRLWWVADSLSGAPLGPSSDSTDAGIFSMREDLTDLRRESTCPVKHQYAAGWLAAVSANGKLAFTTSPDNGMIDGHRYLGLIVGNEDNTRFDIVGAYRATQASNRCLPNGVCFIGETLYLSATNGASKTEDSLITCEQSARPFRGNYTNSFYPETIHPVFWVDSARGSDTNNGFTPVAAFASLSYALTGDRVTYGARVQLVDADTEYTGAAITPKFNAGARGGDLTEFATVQGLGASRTALRYGVAGASGNFFLINANSCKLNFRNMRVEVDKLIRIFDIAGATNAAMATNAKIGAVNKPCNGVARSDVGGKFKLLGSVAEPSKLVNCLVSGTGGSYCDFELVDSAVLGGNRALIITNTGANNRFVAVASKFYGFAVEWLNVSATANFSELKGMTLDVISSVSAAPAITGGAAVTWGRGFENCRVANPLGVPAAFGAMLLPVQFSYSYNEADYLD